MSITTTFPTGQACVLLTSNVSKESVIESFAGRVGSSLLVANEWQSVWQIDLLKTSSLFDDGTVLG